MIEFKNVSKQFGNTLALDKVNLDLKKGECIGLIGPNACGKTTLIKSILNMVIPTSGLIEFEGSNISGSESYRQHIGYMPQIGRYPENMSILQVVNIIKSLRSADMPLDETLWHQFGLDKISEKKMSTLSGGTTQKVSATLAFLFDPKVLILDEPTAGLDPLSSDILRDKIVAERQKGKLILITSHLLNELDDLLTHIIFMQDGKIIFYKSIEELFAESGYQKVSKAIRELLKMKES